MELDKETQARINIRRKKILQDRYDFLYQKRNPTRSELKEMSMLEKRIKKL